MKTLALTLGALVIAAGASQALAINAHTIFVVDESGSMSGEHAWLGGMVADLDTAYTAAGVDSNYGLVGFGGGSGHTSGHVHTVGGGQFGTAAQFATATSGLLLNGSQEDGWDGIETALGCTFGAGNAINIVLVTDEPRTVVNGALSYAGVLADLTAAGALLNVVVNADLTPGTPIGVDADGNTYAADGSGGYTTGVGGGAASSTTKSQYIDMAWATGGAAWDLNQLRAGGLTAESFTAAFVDVKVEEVKQEIVPTPSAALAGLALVATAMLRRKRAA